MELYKDLAQVKQASRSLVSLTNDDRNRVLNAVADKLIEQSDVVLEANGKDCGRMEVSNPMYDRLMLTKERISSIAVEMRNVANLPNPLGTLIHTHIHENGMEIQKVSVPLGVIGMIYEARPNVTYDVFGLCFKSGNACVLKGGKDAADSNLATVKLIKEVLLEQGVNPDVVYLLENDRDKTTQMMQAVEYIDVIIPRGSHGLIQAVREHSKVPVIETGAGIVHTYVDESADLEKAAAIVFNSKTRRVSVCNALDCLILHKSLLSKLPAIVERLSEKDVIICADQASFDALDSQYPYLELASDEAFGIEFLGYKMSIKTVSDIGEAIDHVTKYSSKHSESIVSNDASNVARFLNEVDAAVVYDNVSTCFTDGAQFGLGAEIGISTQKLHARGPMGLEELTSYKWIVHGDGQVR